MSILYLEKIPVSADDISAGRIVTRRPNGMRRVWIRAPLRSAVGLAFLRSASNRTTRSVRRDKLIAMRGPGESYSDVILRLMEMEAGGR